ncbi:hypothetical protein B9Z55_011073 [Caenorhabditis nigoni]|uniref:Protein HIRA n=2 Tax=Caenorhabditis nigoni TaxID=1611254 RepID=A0A2G5UIM7_9PELO|nr:hypothetical protein B9Z55_011073 [Caenorhabditis nigoni]
MGDSYVTETPFVHHDTGPILAIDCHPSGKKFITCGQKAMSANGLVVVWNMEPVLSKSKANDENVPKLLFQVESNSQSNSCRWSPDGNRFAFGSDDSSVSVWEYVGRINSLGSITGGAQNVERYKECCVLRGHRMEVLAVEWSPNGKYLASGSLDHRIIVYNARKLPDQIAVLTDCQMPVKGLSWDPIGKYLASLEGDKKLRFWATDSWQCVTSVTEPFEGSKEETVLSRMDWSPDGKYLMTPAAVRDGQPLVKLVQRKSWKSDQFLAGHTKGTTCVRAMPRLLDVTLKNGKRMQLTCAAVGSRDKSISIWIFPRTVKPLLVINNIFHHTVMDFAWCGRSLLACSQDGSVKVINLSESVIGDMITNEAMSDLCYQIYSIRPPQYETGGQNDENDMDSMDALDNSLSGNNNSFITCPEDIVNRRKQLDQSQKSSNTPNKSTKTTPKEMEASAHEKKMMEERNKQIEVVKDGKRRIQPVFCGTTAATSSDEPPVKKTTTFVAPPPVKKRAPAPMSKDEVDLEESSDSDDDDEDEEEDDEMETSEAESGRSRKRKTPANTTRPMMAMDLKKPVLRPMEPKSLQTTQGTVVMEAPEQQPRLSQHVLDRKGMFVEVDNRWKQGGVETTQIKLVKKKQTEDVEDDGEEERRTVQECVWMTVIGVPVIMVAANKHHVLLGCGDKSIRAYRTICGSHMFCLRLDALPVIIGVKENAVFALTESAHLNTWNLKSGKAIVARQPLFDCVEATADNSLISVDVSESGVPLIVFSNGSIFTYNVSLSCWIQAITTNVLGRLTSAISDAQLERNDGTTAGPLVRLLKRMRKQTTAPGVQPQVVKAIKESQLEQLLHCAEQLGNPHDYQTILMLYVETLCEGGSEKKMKNVLNELTRNGAPMQVCGLRRAALCDDVTRIIKQRQPVIAERIVAGAAGTTNTTKTRSLF